MTEEDAKKTLQDMWECLFNEMTNHTFEDLKEHGMLDNYSTAFDMALSALSAIEKIRAEIQENLDTYKEYGWEEEVKAYTEVLEIIDKHIGGK